MSSSPPHSMLSSPLGAARAGAFFGAVPATDPHDEQHPDRTAAHFSFLPFHASSSGLDRRMPCILFRGTRRLCVFLAREIDRMIARDRPSLSSRWLAVRSGSG